MCPRAEWKTGKPEEGKNEAESEDKNRSSLFKCAMNEELTMTSVAKNNVPQE